MGKKYGFFSEAAKMKHGSTFYINEEGIEVEVTSLCVDKEGKEYNWPDKRFVGEAVKYSRDGVRGNMHLAKYLKNNPSIEGIEFDRYLPDTDKTLLMVLDDIITTCNLATMLGEIETTWSSLISSCLGGKDHLDPKACSIVLDDGSTRCVSTPLGYFLEVCGTGWCWHADIDGVNEHLIDYGVAPIEA